MKYYYFTALFVAAAVAIYGFAVPFLISYPNDLLSFLGFALAIGAVPVFFKLFKNLLKKIVIK